MSVCLRTCLGRSTAATLWLLGGLWAAHGETLGPLTDSDVQLEPVNWAELDGWTADDHAAAFKTFLTSCRPFLARKRVSDTRPIYAALWGICKRAANAGPLGSDKKKARAFFEKYFRPMRIAKLGESTGLVTGYFEPVVNGTRIPNPEFHTPLYRRPRDLVAADQKPGSAEFPNRGVVGRLNDKKQIEPYYDRGAIENGALDGRKLEIAWLKDPFEAMSIQIQGSARVKLEDGTTLRVNYDGHNGYSYTAIGRILIERNLVPREEMSMERIRQWMAANPDQAQELRAANRSFVFFRVSGLSDDGEPSGAQGVPLTAGRSIAVDKLHVYGTPFFIQADLPIESARATTKFRRLMVAQDTGSAITGPARADLYWGAGDEAGRIAGRIRQQGRFVMLLPRELDPVEAGKELPLPPPKPVIAEATPSDATRAKATPMKKSRRQSGRSAAARSKGGRG
jgi:membrane-bound lytic murein transglycosylase A